MRPTRALVRVGRSAALAVVLGCVVGLGPVASEAPVGEWSMSTRLGDRTVDATMTLSLDEDGNLTGSWASQGREMALTNIVVDAERISFDREIPGGALLHFEGAVSGDTIEGSWHGGFGDAPCTGQRGGDP